MNDPIEKIQAVQVNSFNGRTCLTHGNKITDEFQYLKTQKLDVPV